MTTLKALSMTLSLISALATLAACARPYGGHGPLRNGNQLSTTSANSDGVTGFGYEIKTGTCTTGHREFNSRADLCLNLQIDANNNNCAADMRLTHFQSLCKNVSWQPAIAAETLRHQTGLYVSCDFSSTNLATRVTTTIHQETSNLTLRIYLDQASATIEESYADGIYAITASMQQTDGGAAARTAKGWKNSGPARVVLQAQSQTTLLQLSCTPSIESIAQ